MRTYQITQKDIEDKTSPLLDKIPTTSTYYDNAHRFASTWGGTTEDNIRGRVKAGHLYAKQTTYDPATFILVEVVKRS